ncbi:hypothetical protein KC354_g15704 [Hortaea werneckii]|nr:hypothetical protein KC354_g15704 [Hortaea werneckii]
MPFNWRLQLRLAITNFVVVFIGVLVMKILLTPIGAYFFPANTTDLTSDNGSLSGKGSSLDNINFSDDSASSVSSEITIGGTPIAATTDAFGRLPDGGKYVELVDKGYSPMHIDLTDGLGELYRVVETVDGQVVYNETFRGEDAEGQYYAAMGNKTLHKRARTPWQVPALPVAEMYELARKGKNLYTKWMLVDSAEANRLLSMCEGVGPDPLNTGWQREDPTRLRGRFWTPSDYGLTATAMLAPIKADLETLTVGTQQSMTKNTPWKVKRNINMNLLDQGPNAAVQYVQDQGSVANIVIPPEPPPPPFPHLGSPVLLFLSL